tara:strand:- start:6170 stop:6307 length:138 start_codon:yes stop_codon:yes gene_type:complete
MPWATDKIRKVDHIWFIVIVSSVAGASEEDIPMKTRKITAHRAKM